MVYIWAAGSGVRPVVFLLKPLTMALIIALAAQGLQHNAPVFFVPAVLGALIASVVGDVLLMLPQDLFVFGLGAFLTAHLLYVYALWGALRVHTGPADLVTAALLAVLGAALLGPIVRGVHSQGKPALVVPVVVYGVVISLMVWRAVSLFFDHPGMLYLRVDLLAAGALLFYASDIILAWNRFVRPVRYRDALVMGTYFAAQWCFAFVAAHTWYLKL